MSEFGGLIRDAREKAGLSPHRVAELIGRASGTVKAWERGRTIPSDPFVVSSLAAVLAIDEGSLFRAAGLDLPLRHEALTIEQELATIAPSKPQPQDTPPLPEPPPLSSERASSVTTGEQPFPARSTFREVPAPLPSDGAPSEAAAEFFGRGRDLATDDTAPAVPKRRKAARERPSPRLAVESTQPAISPVSYMEDPDERWSYRLRSLWTAAGVGILGLLLLWAGSRALDAFGETWDALLAGL